MEDFAELIRRLLELQRDERERSPRLIAEDKQLIDGLLERISDRKSPHKIATPGSAPTPQ
jgi:hypothetical protein